MKHFEKHFVSSLAMIILGIMLLSRPGFIINRGARLLGIALVAVGVSTLALRGNYSRYGNYMTTVGGFAAILAGLVIFFRYRSFLNIFPTAAGLLIIINSLLDLSRSYDQGRRGERHWLLTAALSLIAIFCGLYIFIHPFKTVTLVARCVGCMFIYNGIVNLIIKRRY